MSIRERQTTAVSGTGSPDELLNAAQIRQIVNEMLERYDLSGKRVLVIIPDGTRTAPIPLFVRLFQELIAGRAAALDYLVALGTHQPMGEPALNRLLGISAAERREQFGNTRIYNHRWDLEKTFITLGTLDAEEAGALSGGLLRDAVPVRINRLALEYDVLLVCGPVFPHEVAGFSGGSKYFSPGISGPEIINFTHWLGALVTSYEIIGTKYTPVRAVIERVAEMIPRPKLGCALVVARSQDFEPPAPTTEGQVNDRAAVPLNGLYCGELQAVWSAAADLSAQVHVQYVDQPFQRVLSVMPAMYDDLWTGAKGMYKLEPVVADGGEVIIYAPHISEISYTHGHIITEIGYHVRDYFTKQWEHFKDYPWGVLAHSTHLRGIGTYENGIERPRIQVTLATGISPERCAAVNLGYRDPASIRPEEWGGREGEGILLVPHAGEILYRLKDRQSE